MKNLLLPAILMIILSACKKELLTQESAQDIVQKELPTDIWLTTAYSMKVKGVYASPVTAGLLQPINFYDNMTLYKLTDTGWPLVARFKQGEYQGDAEAEVYTHYIAGYKIKSLEAGDVDELTATVEVIYGITEFAGGARGRKKTSPNNETEVCYDAAYAKTIRIKLRKYNDGWHLDSERKPVVVKSIQSADSLVFDPRNTSVKACLTLPEIRIKSFLVYDEDGSLSNFDPLKEDNFNGIKPHSNAKVVIIGNMKDVSFTVTNADTKGAENVLFNKHFDLKDSVEFIFPGYCDRLRLDLQSGDGKVLFQDYMNYSCGG
jgi:hypothetical protein